MQHRLMTMLPFLLLPIAVQAASPATANPANHVAFRQQRGKVHVMINGKNVATYVYADPKVPRPYFADVHAPDGTQVTRNFPPVEGRDRMDHDTMHPGIWMAFGDLNGTDIWRNKGRVVHERFVHKPSGSANEGSFVVRNRYETGDKQPICFEVCRFTFLVRRHGYLLLWDTTFSSESEFYFGDQEEMGLGIRLATPIAVVSEKGGRILDSKGRRNGGAVWGKTGDWCDYSGPIDGKFAGISIVPHPENFRPCWWHARDYGFVAANPFGRAAFKAGPPSKIVVSPDAPLRLRFGILVHSSAMEQDVDLAAAYHNFLDLSDQQRGD